MMTNREFILENLVVGDIFHAESPNGASLICLVTSITKDIIEARTVTTQLDFRFDRRTGVAKWGDKQVPCTIDSVAPLPAEIHSVMLGLDRKFRFERDPVQLKLNDAEKRALIYIDSHYSSNRLESI
jgi:hypothetical protein